MSNNTYSTITIGSPGEPAILNAVIGGNGLFTHHAPKPKGIKAVKATDGNLNDLAKFFDKRAKSVTVGDKETGDSYFDAIFSALGGHPNGKQLVVEFRAGYQIVVNPGDWIVEEYDYEKNRETYRLATLAERRKHDLR